MVIVVTHLYYFELYSISFASYVLILVLIFILSPPVIA